MKLRNISASTLILVALLFSSFAFFVTAEESSTSQNNVFMDSDQDGLTDSEEKAYGTDPHNPDTDQDGYSDGAEVKSGYNPLKPAPGDKLTTSEESALESRTASLPSDSDSNDTDPNNLTEEVAQKITALTQQSDTDNPQVSLDQINQLVNETLDSQDTSITLPEIDRSTINIKKQDYSKSQAEEKMKEDFINYIAAIFYILASNSPTPITSSSDAISAMTKTMQQVTMSITTSDSSSLDDLSKSGEAILDQLKEMEVPEDLVDFHIKALQYATYASTLKDSVKTDPSDPVSNIVNMSKIGAFIQSATEFIDSAQEEIDKYDADYTDIQARMKDYGIDLPASDLINSALNSASDSK